MIPGPLITWVWKEQEEIVIAIVIAAFSNSHFEFSLHIPLWGLVTLFDGCTVAKGVFQVYCLYQVATQTSSSAAQSNQLHRDQGIPKLLEPGGMYYTSRANAKSCSWSITPIAYLETSSAGALKLIKTWQNHLTRGEI